MTTVCFLTVCGGGEDYEFLLGAIEHHSRMGVHVVLDTTPVGQERKFMNLPPHVVWIWEPTYGQGWRNFKFRDALMRGVALAKNYGDVIAVLDCDEFYTPQLRWVLDAAAKNPVLVETIHWMRNGHPYMFGESEWHLRLWPSTTDVSYPPNQTWVTHPDYNGNDHHHAVPRFPVGTELLKVPGSIHHHLHYALGKKSLDDKVGKANIPAWHYGHRTMHVPWPAPLEKWRDLGILPSTAFEVSA
jgi:hypothetical protein